MKELGSKDYESERSITMVHVALLNGCIVSRGHVFGSAWAIARCEV